jgi:hypothetical protein
MIEDHDNKTRVKTKKSTTLDSFTRTRSTNLASVLVRHSRYGIPVDLQY